jgi:hypothetical protein
VTDNAPPAADGPAAPTSLPVGDNLRPALALLRHAYDCAQDAAAASWDFALEIGELYASGLTITDLRWLVVKGFVEHGDETSVYGDAHRSFTRSAGFNFLATTCVVLRERGAAFASQVLRAAAAAGAAAGPRGGAGKAEPGRETPSGNGDAQPQAALKPHWDPVRRKLSLGGRVVKQFRVPAGIQAVILGAFQEDGWPEYIDDPLPGGDGIDPKVRLNGVIYRLNHAQATPLIRFHANGNGDGVHWSLCDPKPRRRRPGTAKRPIAGVGSRAIGV